MTDARAARQLHLFKGKRQRGVAVDYSPSEFQLQCAVADTLRVSLMPNWVWNHIPGGEARPAEYRNGVRVSYAGERLKRAGFQPGWPDLVLLSPKDHPIQRPFFLELKRRGGKLSEAQEDFQFWCMTTGGCPFAVADNYEDALAILQQWGAVRTGITVSV